VLLTNVDQVLCPQVAKLEEHLKPLRTGKGGISKEDSDALERIFSDYMFAWQRRKRMFNDVWCAFHPPLTGEMKRPWSHSSLIPNRLVKQEAEVAGDSTANEQRWFGANATATVLIDGASRGTIADGITRKEADIFDEVGVDTDEVAKVSYRDFSHLLPKQRR
jgi:hypothetical protein